jgi:hypothetical protein
VRFTVSDYSPNYAAVRRSHSAEDRLSAKEVSMRLSPYWKLMDNNKFHSAIDFVNEIPLGKTTGPEARTPGNRPFPPQLPPGPYWGQAATQAYFSRSTASNSRLSMVTR